MSRQPRKRQRCRNVGGRRGWWKGKRNEERFYYAFCLENFVKPKWFKKIRRGTVNEDRRGIDFVIENYTKPEIIFVQIKSPETGKIKFWKKHLSIDFEFPLIVLVLDIYCRECGKVRRLFFETLRARTGLS